MLRIAYNEGTNFKQCRTSDLYSFSTANWLVKTKKVVGLYAVYGMFVSYQLIHIHTLRGAACP